MCRRCFRQWGRELQCMCQFADPAEGRCGASKRDSITATGAARSRVARSMRE